MPDMSMEEVMSRLATLGLRPADEADIAEITHRINAIEEAAAELENPAANGIEPIPVFWMTEEAGNE